MLTEDDSDSLVVLFVPLDSDDELSDSGFS